MSFSKSIVSRYKSNPFVIFSVIFLLLSIFLYMKFAIYGYSFIERGDAYNQYLRFIIFYSDYLKSLLKNLFIEGRLSITEWSFAFGEGDEIISNGNYYGLGDPINLLSVLFNRNNMYIFYELRTFARFYISGIAFIMMCRETLKNPTGPQLASGAILYVFCSWNLSYFYIFSCFIIPMVYTPFVIWGVERILHKKSAIVLIISLAVFALSNYYFIIIAAPMLVGYVLIKLFLLYRENLKGALPPLLRISGASFLGILLSSVILIPSIAKTLISPRGGIDFTIHILEENLFYLRFPEYFLQSISAASLVAILLMLAIPREHLLLKTTFIISTVMLCLQIVNYILSGFSFPEDRWKFVTYILYAYLIPALWNEFGSNFKNHLIPIVAALSAYCIISALIDDAGTEASFSTLAFAAVFTLIMSFNISFKYKEYIILLFCSLCSFITIAKTITPELVSAMMPSEKFPFILDNNEGFAIEALRAVTPSDPSDPLTRYSGEPEAIKGNTGTIRGLSSTAYDWSLPFPYGYAFRKNLAMLSTPVHRYTNYNSRTVASAISSIKYFISKNGHVPYGYTPLPSINVNEAEENLKLDALKKELGTDELTDYQASSVKSKTENYQYIYQNDYSLPLGSTYDSYIPYDTYMRMSAPEKEWSMLDAVSLKDYSEDPSHIFKGSKAYLDNVHRLSTKAVVSDEITVRGDQYISPIGGAIDLSFDAPSPRNCEYYCYIEGIEHEEITSYDLYFGDDEKYDPQHRFNKVNWDFLPANEKRDIIKEHFTERPSSEGHIYVETPDGNESHIIYDPPYRKQYNDRHDYVVNLGYYEDGLDSVRVSFTQPTILTLKNISVYALPMEDYPEKISRLKEKYLDNVTIDGDVVTGNIELDSFKFLYLSIPFSKGWHAYDNGTEVPLYCANDMYMALPLEKGAHSIKLEFKMPLLRTGAVCSLAGVIILLLYIIIHHKKQGLEH